jgi:FkbH-like protein
MQTNGADSSLRLVASRHLVVVDLGRASFVGHAVFGGRRLYDKNATEVVRLFATPRTVDEAIAEAIRREIVPAWIAREVGADAAALARRLAAFLREARAAGFLIPADGAADEEKAVAARLRKTYGRDYARAFGLDAIEDAYEPVPAVRLEERLAAPEGPLEPVRFLLLGWCFAQSVRPLLEAEARRRGLEATVHVGFPVDFHLVAEVAPDVTVLQLSHRLVLAPLLDPFPFLAPEEVERRVAAAQAAIREAIAAAARAVPADRLLLVEGIAAPQTSPLGALDFRHPVGFFEVVARLNRTAREETAALANALFVDEEALLASFGKSRILDDLVSTYSHHGMLAFEAGPAAGAPLRRESFALEEKTDLQQILARAYVDLFEAWRGRGLLRCVAVDLDGTLWPGEIADDAFSFDSGELTVPLMYGRFGGLHQALKIVKDRGILLAVVSKNSREDVLAKWRPDAVPLGLGVSREETAHYLRPEDFAVLKIGWEPKSEQLRALAAELGISLAEIAFVDDHPVEREEVRQRLPEVLVLGDDMNRVREALLTSPRFQPIARTDEARRRAETTRARLAREAEAREAPDRAAFLASLAVRCLVRRERDQARVARVAELLRRTNQFNTSGRRLGEAEVAALIAREDAAVFTLEVADRFADYGLVGAALLEGAELACCALSCRVIGVEAEVVLLRRAALFARARGAEMRAPFVRTDRNLPALRLFLAPGFEKLADGSGYRFDFARHEPPADPPHCAVREES